MLFADECLLFNVDFGFFVVGLSQTEIFSFLEICKYVTFLFFVITDVWKFIRVSEIWRDSNNLARLLWLKIVGAAWSEILSLENLAYLSTSLRLLVKIKLFVELFVTRLSLCYSNLFLKRRNSLLIFWIVLWFTFYERFLV